MNKGQFQPYKYCLGDWTYFLSKGEMREETRNVVVSSPNKRVASDFLLPITMIYLTTVKRSLYVNGVYLKYIRIDLWSSGSLTLLCNKGKLTFH